MAKTPKNRQSSKRHLKNGDSLTPLKELVEQALAQLKQEYAAFASEEQKYSTKVIIQAIVNATCGKVRPAESTLQRNREVAALIADARGQELPPTAPDVHDYTAWALPDVGKRAKRYQEHRRTYLLTWKKRRLAHHAVALEEVQRHYEAQIHAAALTQVDRFDLLAENTLLFQFAPDIAWRSAGYLRENQATLVSRCCRLEVGIDEMQAKLAHIDAQRYTLWLQEHHNKRARPKISTGRKK